jgi:5-methylcytosine-specific restriction protein B
MNLSHVERYFSDFLSAMESGEPLYLHQESKSVLSNSGKMIPTELKIPKNIFITGTVNIDETTYMFSPKVLDRSNVIEFSINKEMINNFTKNGFIEKEIIPADEKIIDYFLDLSIKLRNKSQSEFPLSISEVDEINESIVNLYTILEDSSQEFAFRTIDEIFRYIRASKQIDPERNITDFLDEQILQKILPKLHGNRRKMEKILFNLLYYTENHKLNPNDEIIYMQNENSNSNKPIFPASNQKIKKMIKSLKNDGFVSYIQ